MPPSESHPNRTHRRILQHRTHCPHGLVPCPTIPLNSLYIQSSGLRPSQSQVLKFPAKKDRANHEYDQHHEDRSAGQEVGEDGNAWEEAPHLGAAAKEVDKCCTSVASKGHCTVYTTDGARFEVPLACLGTAVFAVLLQMSKEEFGFTGGDDRITLPCDAMVMEYALCLLRRGASEELEKAFLSTMTLPCHSENQVAPYVAACC